MATYLHQRNFEECCCTQVLLISCKVHSLTLNNSKKSHTVMQRSDYWEQVKGTQRSVNMCFYKRDLRFRSSTVKSIKYLSCSSMLRFGLLSSEIRLLCSQCFALLFEVPWLNKIYKRILSLVKKRAERFQWERICKRGGEFFFFFFFTSGGDLLNVIGGELVIGRNLQIPEVLP